MISAITTTHAIPQKLLPTRVSTFRSKLTICQHCFQILGSAKSPVERRALEADHICKEKVSDRQPAATVPFN